MTFYFELNLFFLALEVLCKNKNWCAGTRQHLADAVDFIFAITVSLHKIKKNISNPVLYKTLFYFYNLKCSGIKKLKNKLFNLTF